MTKRVAFGFAALGAVLAVSIFPSGARAFATPPCIPISTPAQLQAMNNNLAGVYCLAKNLQMNAVDNFTPIGSQAAPFTGQLYGRNHIIRNLTIENSGDAGLFGATDGALIRDLGLVNIHVHSPVTAAAGALIGIATAGGGPSTIFNVFATGKVRCDGIACNAGGLVASTTGAVTIERSWADATVRLTNTDSVAGGLVGHLFTGGQVLRSYSTGRVICTGTANQCGGMFGTFRGISSATFATGNVLVNSDNGGGYAGTFLNGSAQDCYATGAVTVGAGSAAGGLVGSLDSASIDRCYSTGPVTGAGGSTLGGLIGQVVVFSTVTNSYWDSSTSGQMVSAGGVGVVTGDLIDNLPTGFGAGWDISANISYPFLTDRNIGFSAALAMPRFGAGRPKLFLPIHQLWRTEYDTPVQHADAASLAAVYTMIARGIARTVNIPALKNAKISDYWDDATQTAPFAGTLAATVTLGAMTPIATGTSLDSAGVTALIDTGRLVILRGTYTSNGATLTHHMLATLYTKDGMGAVDTVVANDPYSGRQVKIDPDTKQVISPKFPLQGFTVNGFQAVTLN